METWRHEPRQPEGPAVIERVLRFIRNPETDTFASVALDVFAFQFERNPPYRRLCERRGILPGSIQDWTSIPAVPTDAFKHTELACAPPRRIFRTSGTTTAARGEHRLPSLDLYRASWVEPFRVHVIPDRERMPVLSLVPTEADAPDSSLAFMAAQVQERFGDGTGGTYLDLTGLRLEALLDRLERAMGDGEPVLLLATAFAMVHLLDSLEERDVRLRLPEGSRIMDTGGFKGKTNEISRDALISLYRERLGVPSTHVVGEYGMTEMCSQFYEPVLSEFLAGRSGGPRAMVGPAWVRTLLLDPEDLSQVAPGSTGLLAHVDLANAWTVAAVVTGDLGERADSGFVVLGRAEGADLRGCSLATEEILGES